VEEESWIRVKEFFGQRGALLPFLRISLFFDLLNTHWLIAGSGSEHRQSGNQINSARPSKS